MEWKKSALVLTLAMAMGAMAGCGDDDDDDDTTVTPEPTATVDYGTKIIAAGGVLTDVDPDLSTATWAAGSTAKLASATTVGGSEPTDYIGAVDPDAATPWWDGWTLHVAGADGTLKDVDFHPLAAEIQTGAISPAATAACPVGAANGTREIEGIAFPVCEISSGIMSDVTLTNDHVYLLKATVDVGDGGVEGATPDTVTKVVVTIEAGTQLFADQGANALVITRGSQIFVNGTAEMPVVMSSVDADYDGGGEWGGLIVDGFAPVNKGTEVGSEAAPDGVTRYFGGTVDADDSGNISYLIIAESGYEFRTDQEVQGLTMEGVGSGTDIDHLQIFRSEDDGVEFFGGSANVKYLVINGVDDDAIDMDLGYTGLIQYALVKMGAANGDQGIESDNNGSNYDALPRTNPTLVNVTILGNIGKDTKTTAAAKHREGMAGTFAKVLYTDVDATAKFEGGCLDVDDTDAQIDDGSLKYEDAMFWCAAGATVADAEI